MPCDAVLRATRYVPGQLFSVNAATARTVPELFARNERVVCDFDTDDGPLCLVLVGALFVGSIETVFAGEINPPPGRGGDVRVIEAGVGRTFRARRGTRSLQHGLDRDRADRRRRGIRAARRARRTGAHGSAARALRRMTARRCSGPLAPGDQRRPRAVATARRVLARVRAYFARPAHSKSRRRRWCAPRSRTSTSSRCGSSTTPPPGQPWDTCRPRPSTR